MKRLLFVGLDVPSFPSKPWSEWPSASPLDYQGLVLNLRELPPVIDPNSIVQTLNALVSHGHTAYVLLPDAKNLGAIRGAANWVPNHHLYLSAATGQTLTLHSQNSFYSAYQHVLSGHEMIFHLQPSSGRSAEFTPGIVDNISRLVCANHRSIYLLHPPAKKHELKAVKAIIEDFKPDVPPILSAPRPAWTETTINKIPGIAEVQATRSSIRNEIERLNLELIKSDEQTADLESWSDLLWAEGLVLQAKVGKALSMLGLNIATDSDPSGHTSDLTAREPEVDFIFEVTGTTGSVGMDKGRQLLQWVADASDPVRAKGVLVASAFRNEPPDNRPPTSDRRMFVAELESLALRYHFALLDTRELFRTICLALAGRVIDKAKIVDGLRIDGIVRFDI